MKNEDAYLRILKMRVNRENRDFRPFTNWDTKTKKSERLLKQINSKIKDKVALKQSLIQFVISDITAFEIYFKDLFDVSFELSECEVEFLYNCEKLVDRRFVFRDLIDIKYHDIRLSDIILEQQNFQNLGSINSVFSKVLQINFFDSLKEYNANLDKDDEDSLILDEDWYPKLEYYLNLRHELTHDYNPKLKLTRKEIDNWHYNLVDFIINVDDMFEEELEKSAKTIKSTRKCPIKNCVRIQ